MYKATGKGNTFKRMIDISDFYLCEVYDRLWGDRIYRIVTRARKENRRLYWYERLAYKLAGFLPPSIIGTRNFINKFMLRSLRRNIKTLEEYLGYKV